MGTRFKIYRNHLGMGTVKNSNPPPKRDGDLPVCDRARENDSPVSTVVQSHISSSMPPNTVKMGAKSEAWGIPHLLVLCPGEKSHSSPPCSQELITVAASHHALLPLRFLGYFLWCVLPHSVTSEKCPSRVPGAKGEAYLQKSG